MGERLAEFRRILKPNGSYYGFASPQMAARVESLTGEYFNVLNRVVWVKRDEYAGGGQWQKANKEAMRAYFPQTEYIIFAEHHNADNIASGQAGYVTACDKLRGFVFEPLREYLASEWKRAGLKFERANEACGTASMAGRHFFSRSQWCLPTKEHYASLQRYANDHASGEYLRREYEELRRPFNARKDAPYTDVWNFPTVAGYTGKHPCEKPLAMMRHIVEMSSRPSGVVLDPMMGSGNAILAARNLGRVAIGNDQDARWCAQAVRKLARNMDEWTTPQIANANVSGLPLFNDGQSSGV